MDNLLITENMISPWTHEMLKKMGDTYRETSKLAPNLYNKKNYICHLHALQCFLRLGCVLEGVNKVLSFTQSEYFASYIHHNTIARLNAQSEFERSFRKLLINSL